MSFLITEADLDAVAGQMAGSLKPGDCVCLSGELGAGKTTLLRTILVKWQITPETPFSSPTFSILNQYNTSHGLVNHVDLYRLQHFDELLSLDILTELRRDDAISFVEWGDKFVELEKWLTKKIHIAHDPSFLHGRRYELSGF